MTREPTETIVPLDKPNQKRVPETIQTPSRGPRGVQLWHSQMGEGWGVLTLALAAVKVRNLGGWGWRANAVPSLPDSRFRGNDGVEIGNGSAIIVHLNIMSTLPGAKATRASAASRALRPFSNLPPVTI